MSKTHTVYMKYSFPIDMSCWVFGSDLHILDYGLSTLAQNIKIVKMFCFNFQGKRKVSFHEDVNVRTYSLDGKPIAGSSGTGSSSIDNIDQLTSESELKKHD